MTENANDLDLEMTGQQYDLLSDQTGPVRYLFLCTTPRTGSHRLCRALYELGLGVPTEYLHPWAFETMGKRWCEGADLSTPAGFDTYWREVCQRRRRGGFVAVSAFGYQIAQVRQLAGNSDRHIFIHLYRRSRSDQVASLMTLYQTKMPYEGQTQISGIPDLSEISPRSIRVVNQFLSLQQKKWRIFLADKPHLAISTEGFFADPADVLARVAGHCGLEAADLPIAEAARSTETTHAYSVNRDAKRSLMARFPDAFDALNDAGDYEV